MLSSPCICRAIKEVASRDVEQGMNKALVLNNKSILKGIAEAPMRIRDGPKLKGIKGIGDQVVKVRAIGRG